MKKIGSQMRETLEESELKLIKIRGRMPHREVLLQDQGGSLYLYAENDHYSGHVIEIKSKGFEFVRTALVDDLEGFLRKVK